MNILIISHFLLDLFGWKHRVVDPKHIMKHFKLLIIACLYRAANRDK